MTGHIMRGQKKVTHAPSRSSENAREHHLLELHEGRSVALDPSPKHGTFPGMNEKARNGRGGQIQPDPFCVLSLSHARLDRTRPRRVDRREALSDLGALVGKLRAEIADHAAILKIWPQRGVEQVHEVDAKPLDRFDREIAQHGKADGATLPIPLQGFGGQGLLTLEMIVKRPFRNTSGVHDVLDAGTVKTLSIQRFHTGFDQLLADVWFRHMGSRSL